MILSALVAIGILFAVFCGPVSLCFGILDGTHAAVGACVTMMGIATICIIVAAILVNLPEKQNRFDQFDRVRRARG